jgi:hypothetical protein
VELFGLEVALVYLGEPLAYKVRYLSLVLIIIKDDVPVTLAAGVAARVGLESRSESDSGLSESSLENTGHGQGTLPGHRSRRS